MATKVPNLKNNLSAQQWRRLQKLSDYTQACIRCRYHAKELGGEKALIVQKQIFPPQEGKVSVNGSIITAVNTFCGGILSTSTAHGLRCADTEVLS